MELQKLLTYLYENKVGILFLLNGRSNRERYHNNFNIILLIKFMFINVLIKLFSELCSYSFWNLTVPKFIYLYSLIPTQFIIVS